MLHLRRSKAMGSETGRCRVMTASRCCSTIHPCLPPIPLYQRFGLWMFHPRISLAVPAVHGRFRRGLKDRLLVVTDAVSTKVVMGLVHLVVGLERVYEAPRFGFCQGITRKLLLGSVGVLKRGFKLLEAIQYLRLANLRADELIQNFADLHPDPAIRDRLGPKFVDRIADAAGRVTRVAKKSNALPGTLDEVTEAVGGQKVNHRGGPVEINNTTQDTIEMAQADPRCSEHPHFREVLLGTQELMHGCPFVLTYRVEDGPRAWQVTVDTREREAATP